MLLLDPIRLRAQASWDSVLFHAGAETGARACSDVQACAVPYAQMSQSNGDAAQLCCNVVRLVRKIHGPLEVQGLRDRQYPIIREREVEQYKVSA